MKTLLVTGGAGFIGGSLVRQILGDGDVRVVNLDKLTYAGNLDSLESVGSSPRHIFVQGDIRDRALVSRLLNEFRPHAIVNLAAESHVDRSIDGPAAFMETNVLGTFELLQAAMAYWSELGTHDQREFRFLQVSTDEVYGSLGPSGQFRETTAYAPNSPYSASKAGADHFVRAYHRTYGLPTLITNCSNNYGPFQFPEKLIPLMILNAVAGKPLPVYGDGKHVRDWLFVDDHCLALRQVLERGMPGEVYSIGGDSELSTLQVVEAVCATVDRRLPTLPHRPCSHLISFVQDRPGHDLRYAIDHGKIQSDLGWKPQQDFESGLEATVQWYLDNGPWLERIRSGGYRGQRLGLGTNTHGD